VSVHPNYRNIFPSCVEVSLDVDMHSAMSAVDFCFAVLMFLGRDAFQNVLLRHTTKCDPSPFDSGKGRNLRNQLWLETITANHIYLYSFLRILSEPTLEASSSGRHMRAKMCVVTKSNVPLRYRLLMRISAI